MWTIIMFLVTTSGLWWPCSPPPLHVSPKTTHFVGSLQADGTFDYSTSLNVIYSNGVTPQNNALIPLLHAFGPEAIYPSARTMVYQEIGLQPLPAEGAYWVLLGKYIREHAPDYLRAQGHLAGWEKPLDRAISRLLVDLERDLSDQEYTILEEWLKANEKPLQKVVEASQRPRYWLPRARVTDCDSHTYGTCTWAMEFAWTPAALLRRAELHLRAGRLEQAWQDCLAVHRLARLYVQESSFLMHARSYQSEDHASALDTFIACHPRLTAEQARTMLHELQSIPDLPDLGRAVDLGERCYALDALMLVIRCGPTVIEGMTEDAYVTQGRAQIDFNVALQRVNGWYDQMAAAVQREDWRQRQQQMANVMADLQESVEVAKTSTIQNLIEFLVQSSESRLKAKSIKFGNVMTSIVLVDLSKADSSRTEAVARNRLAQVSFSLKGFRADKQRYPRSLAELSPRYLDQVPNDPFSGGPFRYSADTNSYVLYSVGKDCRDDGADEREVHRTDDIILRVSQ